MIRPDLPFRSSRHLAAAALAAVLLVLPAGPSAAQDAGGPAGAEVQDVVTQQRLAQAPRTDPYSDAPVIAAPEAAGFNSFAGSELAAPMPGLPDIPGAPVVVELFTSQGCSSCPPADAMLADLARDPDVLPLSFHVDYWDYLGWKDMFAQPEFTKRQQNYARSVGERAVYTPQLIVGGQDTAPSMHPVELMGMIDAHRTAPAMVNVTESDEGGRKVIELTPLSDLGGMVAVTLVRFAPARTVDVKGGENNGRSITYYNVVLDLARLANWDGRAPLRLTIGSDASGGEDFPADTRHAILIQRMKGAKPQLPGAILTALTLD